MNELNDYMKGLTGKDISEELKLMMKKGLIDSRVNRHAEIYQYYKSQKKSRDNGDSDDSPIQSTCDKFNLSRAMVHIIINKFK
jgi:hypothetical protein